MDWCIENQWSTHVRCLGILVRVRVNFVMCVLISHMEWVQPTAICYGRDDDPNTTCRRTKGRYVLEAKIFDIKVNVYSATIIQDDPSVVVTRSCNGVLRMNLLCKSLHWADGAMYVSRMCRVSETVVSYADRVLSHRIQRNVGHIARRSTSLHAPTWTNTHPFFVDVAIHEDFANAIAEKFKSYCRTYCRGVNDNCRALWEKANTAIATRRR